MKTIIIFIIISPLVCFGQRASIITKTDSVNVKIKATTPSLFMTNKGNIFLDDVLNVVFHKSPTESVTKKLDNRGIQYSYMPINNDDLYGSSDSENQSSNTASYFDWKYDDSVLKWVHVFENNLNSTQALNSVSVKLKSLPEFEHEIIGENIIIGSFKDMVIPSNTSSINTPYFLSQGSHKGSIKIQFKDGRYKVEVYNLHSFVNLGINTGLLYSDGQNYNWSKDFINKRNQIRLGNRITLNSANDHFLKIFNTSQIKLDDDF
ncbi:MAG: hypothetical protein JXQ96_13675 [Cyclobacteriaceae bacterium]